MVEPATGVSGALGALQASRPVLGSGGESGSLSSAASELSQAARGLQSVQGQVAGQTMAIQQMSMSGQQQMQQLGMLMSQLNSNISQLIGAMNAASGAQRMAQMATPAMSMPSLPAINPMHMAGAAMGGLGAGALWAGRSAFRGLGAAGGAMAAPFMPGTYAPPMAGQMMGSINNAGAARSIMMGTGLVGGGSFSSSAAEIGRLSADRGAFKAGEIMLGAGTGLMGFGANMLGGAMGMGIGGAMGGGLGRIAGGFLGGPLIGSALMAPVNQVLDQVGMMRGGGEMMGRNAFRVGNALTDRPSFRERGRMGAGMFQDANSDLAFSNSDMQQIFGGAVENDLMRGVSTSQQTRSRMRQLKESVKTIGQTLAMSIQDSMSLMGELQGVGVTGGMGGVMGNANVMGLTRQESMAGQMQFMGRFAGTGLQGRGLMSLAATSQGMGQFAMNQGLLSPEKLAAIGGRQGAGQVYGDVMTGMMQGNFGQLAMAARMGAGGGMGNVSRGGFGMMNQAGAGASTSNLISFAANNGENMREMLNSPHGQARMMSLLSSTADQFKGLGDRKDIMKLILKGQGIDSGQASAFLDMDHVGALREQMMQQQRALLDMQMNQRSENFSISGRIGRSINRATMGISGAVTQGVAGVQDTAANMTNDLRNQVLGIREVATSSGDVNVENLRKLRSKPLSRDRSDIVNAKVSPELKRAIKSRVFNAADRAGETGKVANLVQQFKESTDPEERKALAGTIMANLTRGFTVSTPEEKKAYEQAISEQFGIDVSTALNGGFGGVSAEDKKATDAAIDDIRSSMGGGGAVTSTAIGLTAMAAATVLLGPVGLFGGGAVAGIFAGNQASKSGTNRGVVARLTRSEAAKELVRKVQSGGDINAAREALRKEGFEREAVDRLINTAKTDKGLLAKMEAAGKGGAMEATELALSKAGAMGSVALGDAGLGEIGSMLSAGPEGIHAALDAISKLKSEDLGALQTKGGVIGEALAHTSFIRKDMTFADVERLGVTKEAFKQVIGGANPETAKLTAEQAKELQMLQYAGMGSGTGTQMSTSGFTQDQLRAQTDLAVEVRKISVIVREMQAAQSKMAER